MGNSRTSSGYGGGSGGGSRKPGAAGGGGSQTQLDERDSPEEAREEIEQSHEEYAEKVEITERQGKKMEERKENVVDNLEDDFEVEDSRIYGSVLQGTMTGPLDEDSDVDVLVVLNPEEHGDWAKDKNGPRNCLRSVKNTLQKKYPDQEVYIDRNVVTIEFSDFKVDVTPAIDYSHVSDPEHPGDPASVGGIELPFNPVGADDPNNGYAIPDTYGQQSWVGSNPRRFQAIYDEVNKRSGGKMQQVAVMAKKWNERTGGSIGSFHMVNMARRYFEEDAPVNASTSEHMNRFFQHLPRYIQGETREPVYQERLDAGMSKQQKKEAAKKAWKAAEKLQEAKELEEQGKTEEAKEKYREVYGEDFN